VLHRAPLRRHSRAPICFVFTKNHAAQSNLTEPFAAFLRSPVFSSLAPAGWIESWVTRSFLCSRWVSRRLGFCLGLRQPATGGTSCEASLSLSRRAHRATGFLVCFFSREAAPLLCLKPTFSVLLSFSATGTPTDPLSGSRNTRRRCDCVAPRGDLLRLESRAAGFVIRLGSLLVRLFSS
jgi:hypothetical protein